MDARRQLTETPAFLAAKKDLPLSFSIDEAGICWFRENLYDDWGQAFRVDDFKLHKKTQFQTLSVFHNNKFGHVMLLDGVVQITEQDWHEYQEKLVVSTLLPQAIDSGQSMEVLVIGGGDGGVATIARKLFPNASVTMVEIDGEVVEAAKTYFPGISESLCHPDARFKLIIGDGVEYVARPENHNRFSAIIVDCSDPLDGSPAEGLFGRSFQENAKKCLTKGGIVLQQSGTLERQLSEVQQMIRLMREFYQYPLLVPVTMQTYPGTLTLVGGSDVNVTANSRLDLMKSVADMMQLDTKINSFDVSTLLASVNRVVPVHQRWLNEYLPPRSIAGTCHATLPTMRYRKRPSDDLAAIPLSTEYSQR